MYLHGLDSGWRRVIAPECLNENVDPHRAVGSQQQNGQDRPPLRSTQRHRATLVTHLERPQNAEVHRALGAPYCVPAASERRAVP